nr:hypothetical protein CFP56_16056 [Quercus suber]
MGRLNYVDLEHDFFIIRFTLKEDYETVLRKGPWFVGEHFLSIRPWEPYFKPSMANVSSIVVWVRLNELPIEYYNVEALCQIGKTIGNVLRVNNHMATKARVSYEGIHKLCFSCGRIRHWNENCSYTIRPEKLHVGRDASSNGEQIVQPCDNHAHARSNQGEGTTTEGPEDNYGPWVVVARKKEQDKKSWK